MAEFQEVIREWARMCGQHHSCHTCRISLESEEVTCRKFVMHNPARTEEIVMEWAAECPEKTLKDVLLEHFPNAILGEDGEPETCAELLGLGPCPNGGMPECVSCRDCWNRPAPEEVAK